MANLNFVLTSPAHWLRTIYPCSLPHEECFVAVNVTKKTEDLALNLKFNLEANVIKSSPIAIAAFKPCHADDIESLGGQSEDNCVPYRRR